MPGIDACLLEAMALPGARGAAVVDWTSGLALGTVGESPVGDHEATAVETAELARMAAEQPSFAEPTSPEDGRSPRPEDVATGSQGAARGTVPQDVIVSTEHSYHLLHFVPTGLDSSVFIHLWLDRADGNLALARLRLRDLAERLVCE